MTSEKIVDTVSKYFVTVNQQHVGLMREIIYDRPQSDDQHGYSGVYGIERVNLMY